MSNNDKTIRPPGADRNRLARAIAMRTAERASDVGHQPRGLKRFFDDLVPRSAQGSYWPTRPQNTLNIWSPTTQAVA